MSEIVATLESVFSKITYSVASNGNQKRITIPAQESGFGSTVNGGELLFLSLATCFCNDLYHEAYRRHINIQSIKV